MEPKDYVITDGSAYITYDQTQKSTLTTDVNKAKLFTYEKANNIIKHSLPVSEKRKYKVIHINDVLFKSDTKDINVKSDISITNDVNATEIDWRDKVNGFSEFFSELQSHRDNLHNQQRENEAEICDIYHYIEFFDLNASQGYKAYKMLQNRLKIRRNIKNELSRIGIFFKSKPQEAIDGTLQKRINGLDHMQYSARVLKELFNV